MKSSLLLVSFAALMALVNGCSTVKTVDVVNGCLPKNTLVIRNNTPYTLKVFRNGVVWKLTEKQGNYAYRLPMEVVPHQELVLYDVTLQSHERVTLSLCATKSLRIGCLVGATTVGRHRFRLTLGTDQTPILITVRGKGF